MSSHHTSSGQPDVSIVVVSYNTREITLECLRSIISETPDLAYEVLFIDNDSRDGSREAVEAEFGDDSRFRLASSDVNLGFAGANNHLAKTARGRFLLLLNPDTVIRDRGIERLVSFALENPDNRIWGGRTLFADGTLNPASCWGDYTMWSQFCRYSGLTFLAPDSPIFNSRGYGGWKRDSVREVAVVTGCFLLLTLEDWNLLGGFDPQFFMYAEEADLCLRSKAMGCRPVITPDAVITHLGGASEKVATDKLIRLLKAEIILLRRHWPRSRRWFATWMPWAGIWARLMVTSLLRRDSRHVWSEVLQRRSEWMPG